MSYLDLTPQSSHPDVRAWYFRGQLFVRVQHSRKAVFIGRFADWQLQRPGPTRERPGLFPLRAFDVVPGKLAAIEVYRVRQRGSSRGLEEYVAATPEQAALAEREVRASAAYLSVR